MSILVKKFLFYWSIVCVYDRLEVFGIVNFVEGLYKIYIDRLVIWFFMFVVLVKVI